MKKNKEKCFVLREKNMKNIIIYKQWMFQHFIILILFMYVYVYKCIKKILLSFIHILN